MTFERRFSLLTLLCALVGSSHGFVPLTATRRPLLSDKTTLYATEDDSRFEISVAMPPTGSGLQANLAFDSVLSGPSEIVEVRYPLPFGLNVEPKNGLAVCTKDGPGGEKVNDVLRYCSQWTLGLPAGGGIATTGKDDIFTACTFFFSFVMGIFLTWLVFCD